MQHEKTIHRQRQRRRFRVRNALKRFSTRPRLSVFRSHKHIYAQVIDDAAGRTVASASTVDKELREAIAYGGNRDAAVIIGKTLAERALAAGVTQVAFDRREYRYHGRIAALADAARDAGLDIGAKPEPKPEPAEGKKSKGAKGDRGKGDKAKGDKGKEKGKKDQGGAKAKKKK